MWIRTDPDPQHCYLCTEWTFLEKDSRPSLGREGDMYSILINSVLDPYYFFNDPDPGCTILKFFLNSENNLHF